MQLKFTLKLEYSKKSNKIELQALPDFPVFREHLERREIVVLRGQQYRLKVKRVNQVFLDRLVPLEKKEIGAWKVSVDMTAKRVTEVYLVLKEFLDLMVPLVLKV